MYLIVEMSKFEYVYFSVDEMLKKFKEIVEEEDDDN